tara:strand:- start:96 stop:410 length:315 start_codon:yes stop_codon:yes gene_type:complete
MTSYAKGSKAYGICDITGFRYRLKDMKKTWDGLLVGPDQWDAKHPQLTPVRNVVDPQALKNPRPQEKDDNTSFQVITNFGDGLIPTLLDTYEITSEVGSVIITT